MLRVRQQSRKLSPKDAGPSLSDTPPPAEATPVGVARAALCWTVGDVLRNRLEAPIRLRGPVRPLNNAALEVQRRQPAADAVLDRVVVDHRAGDDELAALAVVGNDGEPC